MKISTFAAIVITLFYLMMFIGCDASLPTDRYTVKLYRPYQAVPKEWHIKDVPTVEGNTATFTTSTNMTITISGTFIIEQNSRYRPIK